MIAAGAEELKADAHCSTTRTVLVAEDSPVTHDLLKLLLNQRGHEVDIVTDGAQALEAFRKRRYDVALLDFHLPDMDGTQVAASIRSNNRGYRVPRLIAITGDVEGLLHSEGCENFDGIIPKPLDIYQVGKIVEEQADLTDCQMPPQRKPPADLKAAIQQAPFLGYECLTWPHDLQSARRSARALQASLGDPRFDAILVKDAASTEDLESIWQLKALHLLPVIDLTGTLGKTAISMFRRSEVRDTDQVERLIRRFQDRQARLHRDLVLTDSLGEKLLGRIFVSDRPLEGNYDPDVRNLVSYTTLLSGSVVIREADALCNEELLQRNFFDRFHVCARCDSKRLHVREECSKCRSSNLVEES